MFFSSSVPNLRSPVFGPKSCSVLCLWSPVCPALPIASCQACSGCSSAGPGGRLPVPWPVAACVQGAARFVEPCLHGAPRAGARPKVPGAVGPKGPKIRQKPGAGFIILSSLRSAQCGYLKAFWPDLFGTTKRPYNWSAGLSLGATGIAGRAPSF